MKAALDGTVEAFGRLDFAFNNAGIVEAPTTTAEMDEAEWDRVINTDLRGVFLCMKYEVPLMLEQGGGCARTRPPSSSGTRGSSTAARRCSDGHGGRAGRRGGVQRRRGQVLGVWKGISLASNGSLRPPGRALRGAPRPYRWGGWLPGDGRASRDQGHGAAVTARGTDAPRTRTTREIAHRSTGAVCSDRRSGPSPTHPEAA